MEEPDFPYPIQKDNSKLKWFAVISLASIGILGCILIFRQPQKIEAKKIIAAPVEYKQLSNSPTVKPTKIKNNVTIQVLNGTGVPGQAGVIVKALEAGGYSLDNIKSGNAITIGGNATTITSRADFEEIVTNIKEILKPVFPEIVDGVLNPNPNEDSGFDIVIVTGEKVSSITPSVAMSPTSNPTKKL